MNDSALSESVQEKVHSCRACGHGLNSDASLSFGPMPVCNRFVHKSVHRQRLWNLSMNACVACGLVQLTESPPPAAIVPQIPWIKYNEPEAHLNLLADTIAAILPSGTGIICGVGPFDRPLLDRLEQRAFITTEANLLLSDQETTGCYPYLETLQARLCEDKLIPQKHAGNIDLICCRYLLEHCQNPADALNNCKKLLAPDGLIMIEIPDCTKFLTRQDYSFVWEEHTCYFTETSFRTFADLVGYDVSDFFRYPANLEDALVFFLRPRKDDPRTSSKKIRNSLHSAVSPYQAFRDNFTLARQSYQRVMESIVHSQQRVAIFGAGHQTIMFINLFDLKNHIASVVDDHPEKIGCKIPGTGLSIISSNQFDMDRNIDICLLGVNPMYEERIRASSPEFIKRGGQFFSIFSGTSLATLIGPPLS